MICVICSYFEVIVSDGFLFVSSLFIALLISIKSDLADLMHIDYSREASLKLKTKQPLLCLHPS